MVQCGKCFFKFPPSNLNNFLHIPQIPAFSSEQKMPALSVLLSTWSLGCWATEGETGVFQGDGQSGKDERKKEG